MTDEELRDRFLSWRSVTPGTECFTCRGSGVRAYSSSATWGGGIGGQTITTDVCDKCWGSGTREQTGADLRKLRSLSREVESYKGCPTWDELNDLEAKTKYELNEALVEVERLRQVLDLKYRTAENWQLDALKLEKQRDEARSALRTIGDERCVCTDEHTMYNPECPACEPGQYALRALGKDV